MLIYRLGVSRVGETLMVSIEKAEYYTVVYQFRTEENEPTPIPPNFVDRVLAAAKVLHVMGFGLEITYGQAALEITNEVVTED